MELTIINYGAGNLFSIENACRKLGYSPVITDNPETIKSSGKVIFPGVGNASRAAEKLRLSALDKLIPQLTQPVLGICLGMQMMLQYSQEGSTEGLSVFPGSVKDFTGSMGDDIFPFKIPHMGWNRIYNLTGALFTGIEETTYMYFVHSFYAERSSFTTAVADYGISFTAALEKDNFYGCQFHPEKSGQAGLQVLKNFLEL